MKHLLISLALFALFFATGCNPGTPAAVMVLQSAKMDAAKKQYEANKAKDADMLKIIEEMYCAQIDLIMDAQIERAGDTIAVETLKTLLAQYRAKMAEAKARIAEYRANLERIQAHEAALAEMDAEIYRWLASNKNEFEELKKAIDSLKGGN